MAADRPKPRGAAPSAVHPHPNRLELELEREAMLAEVGSQIAGGVMAHVGELSAQYQSVRDSIRHLHRCVEPDARDDAGAEAEHALDLLVEAYGRELVSGTLEAVIGWITVDEMASHILRVRQGAGRLPTLPSSANRTTS